MTTSTRRAPRRSDPNPHAGVDLNQKRSESDRISADIADFERNGGRVEKLGTTRVLLKVDAPPAPARAGPRKR